MSKKFIDMIGLKYNRLTVLSKSDKPHTKGDTSSLWNCICECGNLVIASRRTLLAGRSKSCGCLRLELNRKQAKKNRRPGIESPLNRLFKRYEWNANDRNFKFDLNIDEFYYIITLNCYYCNTAPSQITKTIRGNDAENILIYNGVDRQNSNEGYNVNNCVACCGICNTMKMDLSLKEFYEQINKIYNHKLK